MSRTLVVRKLEISPATADKILHVHGIHEDEVKATIEGSGRWEFSWHDHPERGRRAIVEARIRDFDCLVVLYPAEGEYGETWNLGSVYPDEPAGADVPVGPNE